MDTEKTPEQLAAELKLLRAYDRQRALAGHDFGSGQRARELSRRQRELEYLTSRSSRSAYELERDVPLVALTAAFWRIGKPRLNRVQREHHRWNTPATKRTLAAWVAIGRWTGADV